MASRRCPEGLVPVPLLLLLLAFSLLITPIQMQDLNSDAAALLAFISSFGVTSIRWNQNKDTCSWQGVTCQSGRVTELRLPGVGLHGDIPQSTLGNLTALRVLSLRFNALTGPIPLELGDIATLSIINLQRNKFTGEIPLTILSLPGLTQLNLADNQLSGPIAPDFAKLSNLQMLYLELNMLQGQLPDLNLTALSGFNVSFNELSGPIPPSLSRFDVTSFLGMSLCGKPLAPCKSLTPIEPPVLPPTAFPPHAASSEHSPHTVKKHGLSGGAIAGIVIAIAAALLVATSIYILVLKRPRQSYKRPYQVDSPSATVALRAKEAMGSPTPTPRGVPMAPRAAAVPVPVPVPVVVKAASPPRAVRMPQREEDSGGSAPKKRLVFFGRSKKTYDLEDLLRASAEVLGTKFFISIYVTTGSLGL